MATGITKNEKLSADVKIASCHLEEFIHPLPDDETPIILRYPNKLSEKEILLKEELVFSEILKNGKIKKINEIEANSVILADNFYALKKLNENYRGKINLIYLDPPYATGMDFQSRDLKHAYNDTLGTAAWLEFIRRRLILMKELLTDDGSIYVHIGHQMLFHLKIIMDEVFGADKFKNLIVRKKCSSKNYTKNQYPNLNDYLLFYSKNSSHKWNRPGIRVTDDWIKKEYPKADKNGRYKLVPIHAPGKRNGETGKPWRGMTPPPGKHWQMLPSKLDELDANGEIHWSKNENPRRKVYLPEKKLIPITDYWDNFRDAHHQSIMISDYPTEKNFDMMKMIVEASSDPDDIVLDPFCGSGTTLHAADELNRKWIGIDRSFAAIEKTLHRLRNGLNPMGDYVNQRKIENMPLFTWTSNREFTAIVDNQVIDAYSADVKNLAYI